MARITSAILQKIAPQTKAELRDRFLPYLNEALVRYGIVNELQVAAFLATAAFESQYFQKTREGRAKSSSSIWIKYQSKYWNTNYMGRGIFQTTHLKNYRTFGQKMKAKGLVTDSEMFVNNPELLEQPKWAVESACEYWETNGLDRYARQGFKGFSALQGRVNKGSAEKVAHDYPNRLLVYERARLALPDDFSLTDSPVATPPTLDSEQNNPPDSNQAKPVENPSAEQPAGNSILGLDRLNELGQKAGDAADRADNLQAQVGKVSKSSLFEYLSGKVIALVLGTASFFSEHWLELLIAAVVIMIATMVYAHFSKGRAHERWMAIWGK